ncbi:MAG: family 16 glycosylhydrolase [Polyangiaceae bacterium]
MSTLLAICAALTVALAAYSLGHYLSALVFVAGRRRPRTFDAHPSDSVAVLVPARNEGDRALRVLASLSRQDHAGLVEAYLLVRDKHDSAIPLLARHYPAAELDAEVGSIVLLDESTGDKPRRLFVVFTGSDPKSEKINWVAPRLTTRFVAILDCDHQAHADWLRSSLILLSERGARMIQGRRDPISAEGLFSLWDSLHQHVGCELFNGAFTAMKMTVFFTGTTAVLETALLVENPLSPCITEDIDFAYGIILKGETIIDNPWSGSAEETSPDLYSFLARRRRWANGHTSAFLRHLFNTGLGKLSWRGRAQFLFHGSHYLMSLGVFALHLIIGVIFIRTFSPTSQVAAVLSSFLLGFLVARTQRTVGFLARLGETLVVFAWLFPAVVIAMNIAQALLLDDFSRAALPISHQVQALGLVGLLAPLVVLLLGLAGFRQLGIGSFFGVVLTYPIAFYLDLSGVLLGMLDWATGAARWRAVSRRDAPAAAATDIVATDPLPVTSIRDSWRLLALLRASPAMARRTLRGFGQAGNWVPGSVMVIAFCAGAMFTPSVRIEVSPRRCEAMDHDTDPWIVPAKKIPGYCTQDLSEPLAAGTRTGTFHSVRTDTLSRVDTSFWDQLDTTFFCNKATFSPGNVLSTPGGGVKFLLKKESQNGRDFTTGSIATKDEPDAKFRYGRFEVVMKPARRSGLITAFFLYRFDPWQEIDAEFLGRDTTKLLVNVYYNPGEEGDLYNYGLLGTPVLVDLGFDAADDFHKYVIEWEQSEIRWFVDDKLVHVRRSGLPTPIPHLPMRFHMNMWPCCSEKLAGPFAETDEQTTAEVRSVSISHWYPAPMAKFVSRIDSIFAPEKGWRQGERWMQPSPR